MNLTDKEFPSVVQTGSIENNSEEFNAKIREKYFNLDPSRIRGRSEHETFFDDYQDPNIVEKIIEQLKNSPSVNRDELLNMTYMSYEGPKESASHWFYPLVVIIGSKWQTKNSPILRGTLIEVNTVENKVLLQLEETEDMRGKLTNKLAWNGTSQELVDKWDLLYTPTRKPKNEI